jgi:hypothetical protein
LSVLAGWEEERGAGANSKRWRHATWARQTRVFALHDRTQHGMPCHGAPLSRYTTVTVRHCRRTSLSRCATVAVRHCRAAPLSCCATIAVRHCRAAPLSRSATVAVCHCRRAPLSQHAIIVAVRHSVT